MLDVTILLDGNVCDLCTAMLVYTEVHGYIFSAALTFLYQRGNVSFPNVWQKRLSRKLLLASGEALPIVPCINPTYTLLAFFINDDWKTQ